jgi:hypothetical protein
LHYLVPVKFLLAIVVKLKLIHDGPPRGHTSIL